MRLTRLLFLAVVLPLQAWGDAGEIRFVQGDVRLQRGDGRIETAQRGAKVSEGDLIITGISGYAQLSMADEAIIAVRPDTRLKVEIYRYGGKETGDERSLLSLLRGGFRTITGWIGRSNKDAYAVKTPTATIGIRGTDHEPLYIPPPAAGEKAMGEPGTYDKVNTGRTVIQSDNGRIELGPNQVGFAPAAPGVAPMRLQQVPSFMRSTPPVRPDNQTGMSGGSGQQVAQTASGTPSPASPTDGAATLATVDASAPSSSSSGTVNDAFVAPPAPALAPAPQPGTVDPRYVTSNSFAAPAGFVAAGGDLSPGAGLGNGAGFVGNPLEGMAILLDSAGNPLTVGTNGGFNYDRAGAPLVDSGSSPVGGKTVNWGVYAGGVISDNMGTRNPQYFFFMGGGDATTPANLLAAMPSPGNTLSFSTIGGYTKPIAESGAIGGSVNSLVVELKNIGGNIAVFQYNVNVTDALGRNWSSSMPTPVPLSTFVIGGGGGSNLAVTCAGCVNSTGVGDARGMVAGNPTPAGIISSYSMKAGTAGVAGAVLAK